MIRKQLYITLEQDRALKHYARQKGMSEAEIVREALDRHLRRNDKKVVLDSRSKAVEELIKGNEELANHMQIEEGYVFNRADIYLDREARWFEKRKAN